MKLEKNIEKFIELRIAGYSFEEIAKELQTSKQTLIEWNKKMEVRNTIQEGKAFKMNNLVKANNFNLENRVKSYLKISKKINDELLKRDLFKVPTETLLKMSIASDNRLRELLNKSFQIGNNPGIIDFELNDGYFNIKLDE